MLSMQSKWDEAHALPRFRPRYPHEQVVRWAFRYLDAPDRSKVKILDLGCGAGRHALFIASEGIDVAGCDISKRAIAYLDNVARERGLRVDTHCCPAHDLSRYADESFDAVLSVGVLYYLSSENLQQSIDEIRRILKPGGQIFCVIRTDQDSRREQATKVGVNTWRIDALGLNAPSGLEAGMEMLFFSRDETSALFAKFSDLQIDQMTLLRDGFRDDDWLVYGRKALETVR